MKFFPFLEVSVTYRRILRKSIARRHRFSKKSTKFIIFMDNIKNGVLSRNKILGIRSEFGKKLDA
jgi:hypothetical protein